jgi:hypothetical protein
LFSAIIIIIIIIIIITTTTTTTTTTTATTTSKSKYTRREIKVSNSFIAVKLEVPTTTPSREYPEPIPCSMAEIQGKPRLHVLLHLLLLAAELEQ